MTISDVSLLLTLVVTLWGLWYILFRGIPGTDPTCKKCYKEIHYTDVADRRTQCRTGLCRKCFDETPAQHLVLRPKSSFSSSEAICPFCGHEFDPNVYGFVGDRRYVTDCERCGSTFYLEVTNTVQYDTYPLEADLYSDD